MAVVEKIAEFIGRKVDIFGEEQEQWKVVHDKAEECFELQELLRSVDGNAGGLCRACLGHEFTRKADFVSFGLQGHFESLRDGD